MILQRYPILWSAVFSGMQAHIIIVEINTRVYFHSQSSKLWHHDSDLAASHFWMNDNIKLNTTINELIHRGVFILLQMFPLYHIARQREITCISGNLSTKGVKKQSTLYSQS